MIKFKIEKTGKNKKIVPYLNAKFPGLPQSVIYKALRNKDIRINNIKVTENAEIKDDDEITLYIKDELLYGTPKNIDIKSLIIYEDTNILAINKPQELLAISEENEIGLDKIIKENYINEIYPCHRLDRNTKGLIIFAKNEKAKEELEKALKERTVKKTYRALVYGQPKQEKATLKAYLFKDSKKSTVIISPVKKAGYTEIITKYNILKKYPNNTSQLEIELVTGKTHQIRAHLAYIGHPIIGDGKYGINEINKKLNYTYQELESSKIEFHGLTGDLNYLNGKTISLPNTLLS